MHFAILHVVQGENANCQILADTTKACRYTVETGVRATNVFFSYFISITNMVSLCVQCFRWTGENSFFIKGDLDCFAIGGGR